MQLRSALLAATILATPIVASAQPVTGLYVGAGAGVNITTKENINRNGVLSTVFGAAPPATLISTPGGKLNGSTGFGGMASVGYGFGNGFRAEIQGDFLSNHDSNVSSNNGTLLNAFVGGGSTEKKYGGFFNVLYDFNGLTPYVVPYLGVGVGYQWINENFNFYNTAPVTLFGNLFPPGNIRESGQSTKGSFAYQGIAGVALPLTTVMPGLALTAEYHFIGTVGNRSYGARVFSVTAAPPVFRETPGGITLGQSYNNVILAGLRYNFGVAPPPPPPAPAPVPAQAPARSYLVFFDWDKATLTDRARQIIREAADNSTHVQYTRIEVNGYTDTSGTPRYNMGLSIRRANAVKAELIKDGVPANAITTQGFGETHLLVPTGPGVREPQNRRVEIIIR
jgi:outer membrane protein OmpA-like peptidoglycan-associated protein